ncbi:S8 family serine peptidase [Chloroflexota bacterium]
MKLFRYSLVLLSTFTLVFGLFGGTTPTLAAGNGPDDNSIERLLVQFEPGTSWNEMATVHRQVGGQVERIILGIGVNVVNVHAPDKAAKMRAYGLHSQVRCVETDKLAQVIDVPDDYYFKNQWGLSKVQATDAWDIIKGSIGTSIAILDTGIDFNHPDLDDKVIASANFTSSPTASDLYGHGSHVAGIAAAETNNAIGVAGLGRQCALMNAKVMGDDGYGYYSWISQGIIWAVDNGADVINMSLGSTASSATLEAAINYAWSQGVVVVAAAGNNGNSTPFYPAYYENCISVAATDSRDYLSSWSNCGEWVDVAAPGSSIYSTVPDNKYSLKSGTSMASPHVAGLAGLVFSIVGDSNGNNRTNDEVRDAIEKTCDNVSINVAHGRINAYRAVQVDTTPTTGIISGRVTDAASNLPIQGAYVTVDSATSTADSDGYYSINTLIPGTHTVTASKNGYAPISKTVEVPAGQITPVNLSLTISAPTPKSIWIQDIGFAKAGKNLKVNIGVSSESGTVVEATVSTTITASTGQKWVLTDTTDRSGKVSFTVTKPQAGNYSANVTDIISSSYVWDTSRGITSATYTVNSIAKGKGKK